MLLKGRVMSTIYYTNLYRETFAFFSVFALSTITFEAPLKWNTIITRAAFFAFYRLPHCTSPQGLPIKGYILTVINVSECQSVRWGTLEFKSTLLSIVGNLPVSLF